MRFDPVHLDPAKHPASLSVTLLQRHAACPRSTYLHLEHEGGPSSPEMIRGSAVHTAIERCILESLGQGEWVDTDTARDIAAEVIAEGVRLHRHEDPVPGRAAVPLEEADFVRMCVFRFAEQFKPDLASMVGVEQMMQLDLAGWKVRGVIDLATVTEDVCTVYDWKSSRALPSHDEISNVRPDGRLMPKQAQLVLYLLLARFGVPVMFMDGEWRPLQPWPVQSRYEAHLVFPAIETQEGMGWRGPLTLDERDLHDFKRTLEGHIQTLDERLKDGDWPAVPGSHCGSCAARAECPVPPGLRDWQGSILDPAHAEQVAQALYVAKRQQADVQKALKEYAKAQGIDVIRCGSDRGFAFQTRESTELDRQGLEEAARRGPVDMETFRRRRVSTTWTDRRLTDEEMAG